MEEEEVGTDERRFDSDDDDDIVVRKGGGEDDDTTTTDRTVDDDVDTDEDDSVDTPTTDDDSESPVQGDPSVEVTAPYPYPAGYDVAVSIENIYEIVPGDIAQEQDEFGQDQTYEYEVGISTRNLSRHILIRNKAKDNRINVGIVMPEFFTHIRHLPFTIISEEEDGIIQMELPARTQIRINFTILEQAGLNLAMRNQDSITQLLKIFTRVLDVTGPVFVKEWTNTEELEIV